LLAVSVFALLKRAVLRYLAFVAVLIFGHSLDYALWQRAILTESLDNSLILMLGTAFLWLQHDLIRHPHLPLRRQLVWGAGLGLLLILWAYNRPPNFLNGLVVTAFLLALSLLWRRQTWRQPALFLPLIVSLVAIYGVRSYSLRESRDWQNAYMNNLAANILPYPDKVAFFAARGLPTTPEALSFAGYVPARYRGDWRPIFGEWLDTRAQSAYIEYLLANPPARLWEALRVWPKYLDPEFLIDERVRSAENLAYASQWQAQNRHWFYNPSGLSFLLWGGMLSVPLLWGAWRGRADGRWLLPLALILTTLPMVVLNLNADAYEARHHVANSLKLRLGVLLLLFFVLDRWRGWGWSLLAGLIALAEVGGGYLLLRDHVSYPLLSRLAPQTNLLYFWDVNATEYRLYQHVPLDESVLSHEVTVTFQRYARLFVVSWGMFGVYPEIYQPDVEYAIGWRNTPDPITAGFSPQGPVYGPYPLPPEQAQAYANWGETHLPAALATLNIRYIYYTGTAWAGLQPFQQALLRHSPAFEQVATWGDDNGTARLYRVVGQQATWSDFAGGGLETLGLSPADYALYQSRVPPNLPFPPDALIFSPNQGALADSEAAILNLGGLMTATRQGLDDETGHALLSLLYAHTRLRYQDDSLSPEQQKALAEWRASKDPRFLRQAGFEYLLVEATWWSYLSAAEQARFDDPQQYQLSVVWAGVVPRFFRLYHLP
jgi:hypothetical protein